MYFFLHFALLSQPFVTRSCVGLKNHLFILSEEVIYIESTQINKDNPQLPESDFTAETENNLDKVLVTLEMMFLSACFRLFKLLLVKFLTLEWTSKHFLNIWSQKVSEWHVQCNFVLSRDTILIHFQKC